MSWVTSVQTDVRVNENSSSIGHFYEYTSHCPSFAQLRCPNKNGGRWSYPLPLLAIKSAVVMFALILSTIWRLNPAVAHVTDDGCADVGNSGQCLFSTGVLQKCCTWNHRPSSHSHKSAKNSSDCLFYSLFVIRRITQYGAKFRRAIIISAVK